MWTIKIALLAAGVSVTAFISNSSADDARCDMAHETAAVTASVTGTAAAADTRAECLPNA